MKRNIIYTMSLPSVLVLGAGSVGLAFAGKLAYSKAASVYTVCREKYRDSIIKNGLSVQGTWGDFNAGADILHPVSDPKSLAGIFDGAFDYIFFTCKSGATRKICQEYSEFIKDRVLISIQNGIGNEEILKEYSDCVLGGGITTNFNITPDLVAHVNSESLPAKVGLYPRVMPGDDNSAAESAAEMMRNAGMQALASENVRTEIWEKALLNIAVNPLTALFRTNVGALLDENMKEVITGVIRETFAAADAEGIEMRWKTADEYLKYLFEYIMPSFSTALTSMYQDVGACRKTEIDFLNGAVAEIGRKHGIDMPYNRIVVSLIKFREDLY